MKKMITRRNFLKAAGVSAAALGLAACGGSSSSTASSAASSTAASSTAAKADGKVYYLNFKPEQDQDWQDLAAEYTKETGVPVTVVTAASGQYETTLMSEMEKSEAPTLFQVNGPVGLANWKDYCYDLSGSQLYGELTSDSFALKDGDAVTSIAYVIETYGIIYNKELLTAAGYKQEDIKGFADLKKVADDIQDRKAELGVDGAFTSAGMDGSSDWRFKTHLANLPIYYEYKADASALPTPSRAPIWITTSRSGICTSPIPPAIPSCWLPRPATTLWLSLWARRLCSTRTALGLTMT